MLSPSPLKTLASTHRLDGNHFYAGSLRASAVLEATAHDAVDRIIKLGRVVEFVTSWTSPFRQPTNQRTFIAGRGKQLAPAQGRELSPTWKVDQHGLVGPMEYKQAAGGSPRSAIGQNTPQILD